MGQRFHSEDDGYGLVIKVLIFTAVLWIGFEGYKVWQAKKEEESQEQQSQLRRAELDARAPINPSPYAPPALPMPTPQAEVPAASVYRCGNSYSNVPCSGAKAVNVAPPVAYSNNSARKEIYLCKDYSGNLSWESVPCSVNGRFMDRVASVPADIPWDQQVSIARQQRAKAQSIAAEQIVPVAPRPSMNARSSECQSLEWLIRRLDERCRTTACSMRELDEVREERRKARDRQYRINC